ncbi:MAG: 16S rRNA (adenine(1518)-N(6)/adenine(1519)-N(6))-dimethyltransferase RsmA [Campylobacterales bacterium]
MIKAKKQFGQNFLKDSWFVNQIIEAMPDSVRVLVEIGPGLGDLTKEILKKRSAVAIEIDRDLYQRLQSSFSHEIAMGRLVLIGADALAYWDQKGSLADEPYDLVANLPYYVATEIILRALRDPQCVSLLVMIQKEVAEKFTAKPAEREFSSLAILAASVGRAELLFEVPPEAFDPAPKVDSAVMRITKEKPRYDEDFAAFLKRAFTQPRKTLQKNLSPFWSSEAIKTSFDALGINPLSRPHELSHDLFFGLYSRLKGTENNGK